VSATLLAFLVVGLGGAAGAMARFGLTMATLRISGQIPVGTLASNLIGCFIMGGVVELLSRAALVPGGSPISEHNRLLFGVGFCGAFTTLSALVLELTTLVQRDDLAIAFGYLTLTLAGGFALFIAGVWFVRLV